MTRNYDFEKLNSLLNRMFEYNSLKTSSFKGRVKGWIRGKVKTNTRNNCEDIMFCNFIYTLGIYSYLFESCINY